MGQVARSVREQTLCDVLLRVTSFGPCTCREIAFALYGEGKTRTRERARVSDALRELEGTEQVVRARPPEYTRGSADLWSASS